ncbi:MAG TPA: multiheme c-type cytochrome [Thiobacillus sp.]|nr:multiheme c-type cytochrome [Thiobacillus sp.]
MNRLFHTRQPWLLLTLPLLLGLLSGCGEKPTPTVETFLSKHWTESMPPQGVPPATFSPLEASLSPEACGQCHTEQLAAWRTSLHSKTMGPGLRWQLKLMDQDQGNRCLRCHAPLAEQKALLALEHGWPNAPTQPPPDYVSADLGHQGLVCAACHVRGHQRFGPPPRRAAAQDVPHGGFVVAKAFQDSRFCAHCHQFPDDGPRIAGKLMEDTYRQWLASPYAGEGADKQTCQSCHMPDRKHLWRGIHDPEMTRRAIEVALNVHSLGGGRYEARANVRNSGAGHHFPTYMVPKVELVFYRHDADGGIFELGRQVIGWNVDTQITRQLFDARIPAGEARDFRQPFTATGSDWRVLLVMRVLPAEHYERIYRDSLSRADQLPAAAVPLLRRALAEAVAARYELLRIEAGVDR